jgi:general secretion pathway protein A
MIESLSTALGVCPHPLDSFEFDLAADALRRRTRFDVQAGISIKREAFDNTRDARFFFPSKEHTEALARCAFMVDDGNMGIGLLSGEIGCGKTLVRTVLQKKLSKERFLVLSLENCLFGFDDLLLEILSQIRGERLYPHDLPDRYSRIAAFKDCLVQKVARASRHLLIVLDEAQQLDLRSLEAYHLNHLSLEDTAAYLRHRLSVAGLAGPQPFTDSAVNAIFEYSHGIPREINRVAKLALDHAIAHQMSRIDHNLVSVVGEDLSGRDEVRLPLVSGL